MITPEKAFEQLQLVVGGQRHQHYDHVTQYSEELTEMCGALDPTNLIKQFNLREDEEAFKNRVKLSQNILLPIINRIQKPFTKALRADDISVRVIPADKLVEITENFYGDDDLRKFLDDRLLNWQFSDPNGWLLIDIPSFDPNTEKAKPYPIFVPSKRALDFEYVNNIPDYLVYELDENFYLFHKDFGFKLVPTDAKAQIKPEQNKVIAWDNFANGTVIEVKGNAYVLYSFAPTVSRCPALQVGYAREPMTEHETFISPVHAAIPTLRRVIRSGSELDMSINLHIFPKKYVVEKPCTGCMKDSVYHACKFGYCDGEGGTRFQCTNCNGSGQQPYHTSSQDVVGIPEALIASGEVKLADVYHYEQTDIDTPTFLDTFVDKISEQCIKDIFQTNYFSLANERTATETKVSYDDIYDTLHPFGNQYSRIWEFCVNISADYRDTKFTTVKMQFPRDLQLQSLDELVQAYKQSEGAPVDVREVLGNRVVRTAHRSSPEEQKIALVKRSLEPFANRSSTEIQTIISNNLASKFKIWLWANFEELFDKLILDTPDIFELIPSIQKQTFEEFAKAIYDVEMAVEVSLGEDPNNDPNNDPQV